MQTRKLIKRIKDKDERVRTDAWLGAGEVGAPAVKRLARVMAKADLEVSRAAKRALWQIVRYAGRPGADAEQKAVLAELLVVCAGRRPTGVRREVIWMLSETGGDECVAPLAGFLMNEELREDARMALERIPGEPSLAALKAGLAAAPDDFKPNIAQSLRARGVEVPGVPCRKLVPTKETAVKPTTRQAETKNAE